MYYNNVVYYNTGIKMTKKPSLLELARETKGNLIGLISYSEMTVFGENRTIRQIMESQDNPHLFYEMRGITEESVKKTIESEIGLRVLYEILQKYEKLFFPDKNTTASLRRYNKKIARKKKRKK